MVTGDSPRAPTAVLALGGHAFIQPGQRGSEQEQSQNARVISESVLTLVERGYNLVVTHGNGPQVGDLLLRNEAAGVPRSPLDVLVAETEGSLGHHLQLALLNELRARDLSRQVVTVVTQVLVDADDEAFDAPTKPVGPFMTAEVAERRARELGWTVGEERGRGVRRLVPSPAPRKVLQRDVIAEASAAGHVVIAAGGGGVPVVRGPSHDYVGVEAVIDKDLTSAVLASDVDADLLVILTSVEQVYLDYGTPHQRGLGAVTLAECERFVAERHFPPGSMGPKIEAILGFLRRGGRRALVTSPDSLAAALDGQAGTHFVGRI